MREDDPHEPDGAHNPGEPEFGRHGTGEHNPGEPDFGGHEGEAPVSPGREVDEGEDVSSAEEAAERADLGHS